MSLFIYKMFNNINMNFFNAQFLILIGIIIVIYFLYKEINFLHKKINNLHKLIEETHVKSIIPIKSVILDNTSSEHIEIYSNDNSITPSSNEILNIIINDSVIELVNETIVNPVIELVNETIVNPVIEIVNELVNENISKPVIETINEIVNKNISNPVIETINELVNENISTTVIENENKNINEEITLNNLEKMKITEIKKVAEKYKITLSKKLNGIQKSKNKKELIDNILNYKKNI